MIGRLILWQKLTQKLVYKNVDWHLVELRIEFTQRENYLRHNYLALFPSSFVRTDISISYNLIQLNK